MVLPNRILLNRALPNRVLPYHWNTVHRFSNIIFFYGSVPIVQLPVFNERSELDSKLFFVLFHKKSYVKMYIMYISFSIVLDSVNKKKEEKNNITGIY